MLERNILEYYYGMFGWILFQQVLEIWATRAQNHLVCLGVLTLGSDCNVTETLLVSQVFEGCDHVRLEIVPTEAELLVIRHLKSEIGNILL